MPDHDPAASPAPTTGAGPSGVPTSDTNDAALTAALAEVARLRAEVETARHRLIAATEEHGAVLADALPHALAPLAYALHPLPGTACGHEDPTSGLRCSRTAGHPTALPHTAVGRLWTSDGATVDPRATDPAPSTTRRDFAPPWAPR